MKNVILSMIALLISLPALAAGGKEERLRQTTKAALLRNNWKWRQKGGWKVSSYIAKSGFIHCRQADKRKLHSSQYITASRSYESNFAPVKIFQEADAIWYSAHWLCAVTLNAHCVARLGAIRGEKSCWMNLAERSNGMAWLLNELNRGWPQKSVM